MMIPGFYFGYRMGIVSTRARSFVSSIPFMRAVAVNDYGGIAAVQVVTVEAPEIRAEDEVSVTLIKQLAELASHRREKLTPPKKFINPRRIQ